MIFSNANLIIKTVLLNIVRSISTKSEISISFSMINHGEYLSILINCNRIIATSDHENLRDG